MADITIVAGVYKPTNITGGHHPAGALLETLQDGFVLSLALIDSNSSLFEFFEAPPAVLASPMASVQLYTSPWVWTWALLGFHPHPGELAKIRA